METLNNNSDNENYDNNGSNDTMSLYYDFIVVGAGSSGMGFLAGLLQANFVGSVAVIERGGGGGGGGHDENDNNHINSNHNNNHNNNNSNQTAHWYRDSHHHHHDDDDDDDDDSKQDSSSSSSRSQCCNIMLTASCWGRMLRVPTGSGLGGTSRIHASLCLAPPVDDFLLNHDNGDDACWPEPCRSQLPRSLDSIQQLLDQNQALHVFHHHHHPDDQQRKVDVAASSSGNKKKDDNDEKSINTHGGCCIRSIPCRCTVTPNGKYRVNYYEGLVAPLLLLLPKSVQTTQIKWFTSCIVQNLVMDDSSVVRGVKLWNKATQSYHMLYAKRKVILAAGVFASPTILMASGLLFSNDCSTNNSSSSKSSTTTHTRVEKHGDTVPVKQKQEQEPSFQNDGDDNNNEQEEEWVNLPLMDHVMIPCAMFSWRPLVSQKQLSWNGVQSLHQVDYYCNNDDNDTTNNNNNKKRFLVSRMDATVHADILPSILVDLLLFRRKWYDIPDWPRRPPPLVLGGVQTMFAFAVHALATLLEFVLRWAIVWTPLGWILRYHVIIMTIFCMNPNTAGNKLSIRRNKRLGRIKKTGIKNPPPALQVKIDLPYLKDEQDIAALQAVWQDCKQLVAPAHAIEFFPGSLIRRCGYFSFLFRGYCRAFCLPFFHWCGTLPLGGSIVDRHFGVRHVESSLCICDASVFPRQVSVPPALTCAALGHCLACLLLQQKNDNNGL